MAMGLAYCLAKSGHQGGDSARNLYSVLRAKSFCAHLAVSVANELTDTVIQMSVWAQVKVMRLGWLAVSRWEMVM